MCALTVKTCSSSLVCQAEFFGVMWHEDIHVIHVVFRRKAAVRPHDATLARAVSHSVFILI